MVLKTRFLKNNAVLIKLSSVSAVPARRESARLQRVCPTKPRDPDG